MQGVVKSWGSAGEDRFPELTITLSTSAASRCTRRSLPPFREREAEGIGLEEVLYGKGMRGGMGGKNQLHVAKMLYKHRILHFG